MNKTIVALITSAVVISSCGGGGDKPSSGPYTPPANIAVSSVSVSPSTSELVIGGTVQLSATVNPSNATDKSVSWSSSNQTVATVAPTGLVTAKAEGSANITANASGKTAVCKVSVKKPTVAVVSLELDQTDISLNKGTSQTLKVTVKPDNATDKNVTWSSSKTDIVTVDNSGKVTAVAKGIATITASCGGKTATCKVTVIIPVESITLNQTSITITEGESQTLVATVKPDDASDKSVTWSSSNASVITVDSNGKVTALAEGSATVSASCGGKEASCSITVQKRIIPVSSIVLDRAEIAMNSGETMTIIATVSPSDATDKSVFWSSSNESVATVQEGVVTALAGGTSIITASSGDVSESCIVRVSVPAISISLSKYNNRRPEVLGREFRLTATVRPYNTTDSVEWKSADSGIVSFNSMETHYYGVWQETSVYVTANKVGTVMITAKCGTQEASMSITITNDTGNIRDRDNEDF